MAFVTSSYGSRFYIPQSVLRMLPTFVFLMSPWNVTTVREQESLKKVETASQQSTLQLLNMQLSKKR